MIEYSLLLLAHLVLFAYWLGGDIGVFYSSYRVCDANLTKEARLTALKIMGWVDMVPRYCMVLILPVGLALAATMGWWEASAAFVAGAWAFALVWLALVWSVHHFQGRKLAETLRRFDLALRVVLIATLLTIGTLGLNDAGPIQSGQHWLALKVVIFGLLVFCGLMIRITAAPFGPAFARIMREGSSPEAEAQLNGAMNKARPFVVLIWIGLVINAYLGALKPAF